VAKERRHGRIVGRDREQQSRHAGARLMRRGFVQTGGRRLETAWWGPSPEAAPSVALLHEGLGCVAMWRDFPALLAEATGCGVLAWSRAGYGASDPVPPPRPVTYMHDEAARDVRPVLDAAGLRDCVLLGHSDGGSIAALYAGTQEDARLRGLCLLAPHVFVEPVTIAGIEAARARYLGGDLRARLARHHADADGAFWGWNGVWLNPAFRDWDIRRECAGINVPALVVQGLADPYGTAAQVEALQAALGELMRPLLLDGVGHAPHLEATAATLDAVAAFVAKVLRR
jgi:pimeloyl-ACP methyl ester carboxylesterase